VPTLVEPVRPEPEVSDTVSSTAPIKQPHAPAAGQPITRAPAPEPARSVSHAADVGSSARPELPAPTPADTQPGGVERADVNAAEAPESAIPATLAAPLDAERIAPEPIHSARVPFATANRRPGTGESGRLADAVGDKTPNAGRDPAPKPERREPSRLREAAPIGVDERDVTDIARASAALPAASGRIPDRRTPSAESPAAGVPQPPTPPSGAPIAAAPPSDTAQSPVDDAAADVRPMPRPARARQIAPHTPTNIDAATPSHVVPPGPASVAARLRQTDDPNPLDRDAPARETPVRPVDQHRPPAPAGSTPRGPAGEGPRRALPEVSASHGRTTQPALMPVAHRPTATSGSAAVADPPSRPSPSVTSNIAQPNGRVVDGNPVATPPQTAPLPPTRTTKSAVDLDHAASSRDDGRRALSSLGAASPDGAPSRAPMSAAPPVVPSSAASADASNLRPQRREPPPVKISIGRVTVAAPTTPEAPLVLRTQPSLSLRDYLGRRRGPP
jgi:hypothetical protein